MGRKSRIETEQDEVAGIDPANGTVVDEDSDADSDVTSDVDADADAESDNVGDVSVEINVEDLIAQIESAERKGMSPGSARRKLEDYLEERRTSRDIMDFEDYELDD
jgi:hypothetical protein